MELELFIELYIESTDETRNRVAEILADHQLPPVSQE